MRVDFLASPGYQNRKARNPTRRSTVNWAIWRWPILAGGAPCVLSIARQKHERACEARVKSPTHPPQRLRSITYHGKPEVRTMANIGRRCTMDVDPRCTPRIQISYSSAAILAVKDGTVAAVDAAAGRSEPAHSMALKMANFQRTIYAQPRRR
ncbi:hypothetical protein THAOC_08771 [Thalassiosira oceanica]|uniref:Uncharacterized protein n=1 Tax=Thalassiosira oceanica TaxID=159749 RepID=K0THG7_THAOC|nr:hypothetical protein THAOC_08771 [Thalassiosira oceanica]|eukprot:EJK69927.1 hypothetical protein THAOC_08771 [Thalassiosira oceanica]